MTHLVTQESVILPKCHILHNMALWPQILYYENFQGFSRKWDVYIMKICKYERSFLLEECAHNVTQYGV